MWLMVLLHMNYLTKIILKVMTIFHIRDQKYLPSQNLLSNKAYQTKQCLLPNKDAENDVVNYDPKKSSTVISGALMRAQNFLLIRIL